MGTLKITLGAIATCLLLVSSSAGAKELSLAYFMGTKHPMNEGVFQPFAKKLEALSGGALTVMQFPGGAINSKPQKQYAILLKNAVDMVFIVPSQTDKLFPRSNLISIPNLCDSATACTKALLNIRSEIETEYNAKLLGIWANSPSVLITRDKPVKSLKDVEGMKIRVSNSTNADLVEAMGAIPVIQPVTAVNQSLSNGIVDAVSIDPSAIYTFKLNDSGKYITDWFPGSSISFALLMNKNTYNALSAQEQEWVDEAADDTLSLGGALAFEKMSKKGFELGKNSGLEIIHLPDAEKAKFNEVIQPVIEKTKQGTINDTPITDLIEDMMGR